MSELYRFRPVTVGDRAFLDGWHRQPQVREWWGEPEPYEPEDGVTALIVEHEGQPFAFMQDYDVKLWPGHHFGYLPAGARGIDQFIGATAMLDRGHGTAFIRQRVKPLFASGVPVIGTDPHPKNARAIAAYRKAGFRIVGQEEKTEWGRVIRMEAWPA